VIYVKLYVHSLVDKLKRPDPVRKLSANIYDIKYCCVYSKKLLMIYLGNIRNM